MKENMKVGILGIGFGSFHAELYQKMEGVEVVKIFGRNEEKLRQKGEALNIATTQNISDIINDPQIELVDICLPTKEHARYIVEALKAGKQVFCETPLCYSREELVQIINAQQKYGKWVFVDQFIKFAAEYQYIYHAVQNNTYGKLKSLTVTRKTPPVWGDLGLNTIVVNLMLHDLDFSEGLLGMPLDKGITAIAGRQGESQVKAVLHYGDAVIEVEACSMMPKSYPFTVSYEAVFENGMVEYHEAFLPEGIEKYCIAYTPDGRQELCPDSHDPYEYAIRHVIDCIRNHKDTCIDAVSAGNSLTIAFDLNEICSNLPYFRSSN